MKVLFFLEPSIEFSNPLFRYATLRHAMLPQIKVFQNAGHDVTVLMSDAVAEKTLVDGFERQIERLVAVDTIKWSNHENVHRRMLRFQSNAFTPDDLRYIEEILHGILPVDYAPDLVIAWETPANFFKLVYPCTKVLYQMPGFFSRAPFPNLVSVDVDMLERSSGIFIEETESLNVVREHEMRFMRAVSPIRTMLNTVRQRFDKIVLYPLQIDGHFTIDHVLGGGMSQFDALVRTLDMIPPHVGVWVTNYRSRDIQSVVLSDASVRYLRDRFQNFIYFQNTDAIPSVSQYICAEVDGVFTISSSIGYQAAFWQKPLACHGPSHLSHFVTANTVTAFIDQVMDGRAINQDAKISSLIRHRHPTSEFMASSEYPAWLEAHMRGEGFAPWTDRPISDVLMDARRESMALEQLGLFNRARKESSLDHCQELSEQIRKHDVVSFDIFDTLLYRPFKSPSDMFDFMNEDVSRITGTTSFDFKFERQAAEREAFMKAIGDGHGEVKFSEIYAVLKDRMRLEDSMTQAIMDLEMSYERDLLYPRASGFKAFQEARSLGKRIILVSDMYLPKDFLESALKKNGYEGYEALYVSSEHRAKKHNGKLFDQVLRDLDMDPKRLLHVGDNLDADIKRAKEKNIKPFHLVKAMDAFNKSAGYHLPWRRDEERHALDWKMILAIIGNKMHDNPYASSQEGTLFNGSKWCLGYYGLGPLLLGYAQWLLKESRRDGVERLYFLARDGKIMKEAFDRLTPLVHDAPTSNYLLCSRRAVNLAKVKDIHGIMDLLHVPFAHNTRLGHLLSSRFGMNPMEIDADILKQHGFDWNSKLVAGDLSRLRPLFTDLAGLILRVACDERAHYLEYLDQMGIYGEGRSAVVDIGYAGTMQESLHHLGNEQKSVGGYYLMTFRAALKRIEAKGLPIKGYLANFVDRHDTYHPFCRHVPLYETLFSNTDTSFVRMTKDWTGAIKPVFMERSPLESRREAVVREIHRGALEFIDDAVRILGEHLLRIDLEPNKTLRVLDRFFSAPHAKDAAILSGVLFEDAYGGRAHKLILSEASNLGEQCVWQQGREALARDQEDGHQKDVASQQGRSTPRGMREDHWVHKVMVITLKGRKKKKFLRNPDLFFYDAKNPFIKWLGQRYIAN